MARELQAAEQAPPAEQPARTRLWIYRQRLDHPIGYLFAFCGMLTQTAIFGTGYALSTFTNAIKADEILGHPGRSVVATASGVNYGMGPFVGVVSGILSDIVGPRPIVLFSAACHAAALLLATTAKTPTEFIMAYGPLMGFAFGCMVTPGSHSTSSFFDKQRSIAMGFNYAGGGVGIALIPHIASLLLDYYGEDDWRPAMRWISLVALGCFIPGLLITKHDPVEPAPVKTPEDDVPTTVAAIEGEADAPLLNSSGAAAGVPTDGEPTVMQMLLTRRFWSLFCVAMFFGYGYYSSVFYWVPFARAQGKAPYEHTAHISLRDSTLITIVFGVVQAVGNVALGLAASLLNVHVVYVGSTITAAAAMWAWPWCTTLHEFMAVAAFSGLGCAGARTIFPALIANHFPGKKVGAMMGFTFMGYGVGGLLGPIVTSAIITAKDENYTWGLSVVGLMCTTSAIVYVVAVPPPVVAVGRIEAKSQQKTSDQPAAVVTAADTDLPRSRRDQ